MGDLDAELMEYEKFRTHQGIQQALVIGYDGLNGKISHSGNSAYIRELAQDRPWMIPLGYEAIPGLRKRIRSGSSVSAYAVAPGSGRLLATELMDARENGAVPRILSVNATPDEIAAMVPALVEMTRTWVLLAHLGLPGPVGNVRQARTRLVPIVSVARCAHVSIKLSGQYAASRLPHPHRDVRLIVDFVAAEVGIERLVWGSDFSPCLAHETLDQSVDIVFPTGCSESDREDIRWRNADRMLGTYGQ